MELLRFKYVVIGSGIAGLSAARHLAQFGPTAILTKSRIKEGATQYAQGGIAAALQEDDSADLHFQDTMNAGDGLCQPEAVRLLVEEGRTRVQELIALGAEFDRGENGFHFTKEGAHSRRRILHAGDATGRALEKTLGLSIVHDPNIHFFPNTHVIKLEVKDKVCVGVWAYHLQKLTFVSCDAVILATGGCGQVFARNTNPAVATGDGIALAYQAGCVVQDMEFIQFHPTSLYLDRPTGATSFLISEAVRGEGALLRTLNGDRFMPEYHELAELAPRDVVARSIFFECQKTQSPFVWLDVSPIEKLAERFPTLYETCTREHIDLEKGLIPVTPAAHYFMGGVQADEWGRTAIKRLYAVGEVASMGIHGANRLASNSLLDGLVFGHRAAQDAISLSENQVEPGPWVPFSDPLDPERLERIRTARQEMKQWMWEGVGIVRTQDSIRQALRHLYTLNWLVHLNPVEEEIREIQNQWLVSKLIAQFALERTESRGAHFREDFPERNDEEWLYRQVHQKTWPGLAVTFVQPLKPQADY